MASRGDYLQAKYLALLPPSPAVLEFTKIATVYLLCTVIAGAVWSFSGEGGTIWNRDTPGDVFWRSTVADIVALDAVLVGGWFIFVGFYSLSRIMRYCRAVPRLTKQVYLLMFPWLAAIAVALTLAFYVLAMREHSQEFRLILGTQILAILTIEIPLLKRWFPDLQPAVMWKLSPECFSVMLGRGSCRPLDQHFVDVVYFQEKVMRHLQQDNQKDVSKPSQYVYFRSDTLDRFQKTLGCLYQTSLHLRPTIDQLFAKRSWSMLDVGGGEGTFTSHLLTGLTTLPKKINIIEPSPEMLARYKTLITRQYPRIELEEYPALLEDAISDLPAVDFVLASHSLYALMDLRREMASQVLAKLLGAGQEITCVIMASKDSQAYRVKNEVLMQLEHEDRSSFGEDVLKIIPSAYSIKVEILDSVIDVTDILSAEEKLIAWLAYFCRLDPDAVRPKSYLFRELISRTALQYKLLPNSVRKNVEESGALSALGIDDNSLVLLHKETFMTIERAPKK